MQVNSVEQTVVLTEGPYTLQGLDKGHLIHHFHMQKVPVGLPVGEGTAVVGQQADLQLQPHTVSEPEIVNVD